MSGHWDSLGSLSETSRILLRLSNAGRLLFRRSWLPCLRLVLANPYSDGVMGGENLRSTQPRQRLSYPRDLRFVVGQLLADRFDDVARSLREKLFVAELALG